MPRKSGRLGHRANHEGRERRAGKVGEARKGSCARFLGWEKNLVGGVVGGGQSRICPLKRVLWGAGPDLLDIFRQLGGLEEGISM